MRTATKINVNRYGPCIKASLLRNGEVFFLPAESETPLIALEKSGPLFDAADTPYVEIASGACRSVHSDDMILPFQGRLDVWQDALPDKAKAAA